MAALGFERWSASAGIGSPMLSLCGMQCNFFNFQGLAIHGAGKPTRFGICDKSTIAAGSLTGLCLDHLAGLP
jgi:hypothetical protein